MINYFIIILTLFFSAQLSWCQQDSSVAVLENDTARKDTVREIEFSKLELRYDMYYAKGEDKPYTGKFYAYYENGGRLAEGFLNYGKFHGEIKGWYENGRMSRKVNYKNGEKHGKWIKWDEFGRKVMEEMFEDGKLIESKEF